MAELEGLYGWEGGAEHLPVAQGSSSGCRSSRSHHVSSAKGQPSPQRDAGGGCRASSHSGASAGGGGPARAWTWGAPAVPGTQGGACCAGAGRGAGPENGGRRRERLPGGPAAEVAPCSGPCGERDESALRGRLLQGDPRALRTVSWGSQHAAGQMVTVTPFKAAASQ